MFAAFDFFGSLLSCFCLCILQLEQNTSKRFMIRSFHSVVIPSHRVLPAPTIMVTLFLICLHHPHFSSFFSNSSSHNSLYSFTGTPLLTMQLSFTNIVTSPSFTPFSNRTDCTIASGKVGCLLPNLGVSHSRRAHCMRNSKLEHSCSTIW